MPSPDDPTSPVVVVLATGGTIAGRSASALDNLSYTAGAVPIEELLAATEAPPGVRIEGERIAAIDSKDMDVATWVRLARRAEALLAEPRVHGMVVTHGTDTLEETAWLLHRVLAPRKPLVLTAAMRPASSLQADGPQNLADALLLAARPEPRGVLVVMNGSVLGAEGLRKWHSARLDALAPFDGGPIAEWRDGRLRRWRPWPEGAALGGAVLPDALDRWPWVELVTSHAGADARAVGALVDAGVDGLVVAGTGNGTVHHALVAALRAAGQRGVAVRLVSRCVAGGVVPAADTPFTTYAALSAPQARVELTLELLAAGRRLA